MQLDTVLNCGQSGFLLVLVLVLEFPNNPSADENENEDEDEYVRTVSSCTRLRDSWLMRLGKKSRAVMLSAWVAPVAQMDRAAVS